MRGHLSVADTYFETDAFMQPILRGYPLIRGFTVLLYSVGDVLVYSSTGAVCLRFYSCFRGLIINLNSYRSTIHLSPWKTLMRGHPLISGFLFRTYIFPVLRTQWWRVTCYVWTLSLRYCSLNTGFTELICLT